MHVPYYTFLPICAYVAPLQIAQWKATTHRNIILYVSIKTLWAVTARLKYNPGRNSFNVAWRKVENYIFIAEPTENVSKEYIFTKMYRLLLCFYESFQSFKIIFWRSCIEFTSYSFQYNLLVHRKTFDFILVSQVLYYLYV